MKVVIVILALLGAAQAAPAQPPQPTTTPYSCRQLYEAEHKCGFGQCDKREIERLRKECLRDGGRP
jgi:hypothetical protein